MSSSSAVSLPSVSWQSLISSAPEVPLRLLDPALLQDLHSLQADRSTALHAHADCCATVAALRVALAASNESVRALQQQVATLQFALRVERRHNRRQREQQSGESNPVDSSGVSASPPPRAVPVVVSLPSSLPAPSTARGVSLDLSPAQFSADLHAIQSAQAIDNSDDSTLPDALPPVNRNRANSKVEATSTQTAQQTSNSTFAPATPPSHAAALSHATTPLPATAIKSRAVGKSPQPPTSSPPLSFHPTAPSPAKTSSGSPSETSPSKPPQLTAHTFVPPTSDEIAAEIANALSPPGAVRGFGFEQQKRKSSGADRNTPRAAATAGQKSPIKNDAEAADGQSTVYHYNNGVSQSPPSNSSSSSSSSSSSASSINGTYTYGDSTELPIGSNSAALGQTAIDLSAIQLNMSPTETATNGSTPVSPAAVPATISSTNSISGGARSAFSPLAGSGGTAAAAATALSPASQGAKQWKPKLQLRSHLDAVRSISFDRCAVGHADPEVTWLLSGSEDGTAQLWNLAPALNGAVGSAASRKASAPQTLPLHTYRGHRGMLTAVTLDSSVGAFTAGVDGSVVQWSMPALASADLYGAYGICSAFRQQTFAHSDAVWSIDVLAASSTVASPLLLTAAASGLVAGWRVAPSPVHAVHPVDSSTPTPLFNLSSSVGLIPCSVQFLSSSGGRLAAVAYTSGAVGLIDVETGTLISTFLESSSTPSRATQLVAQPNSDIVLSGHVDAAMRFWDSRLGAQVSLLQAHRGIVSCVAMDASGERLVSGSHDESIRIWSSSDRKIKQVLDTHQTHRLKGKEAIHAVTFNQQNNDDCLASAGADGIIKVYV